MIIVSVHRGILDPILATASGADAVSDLRLEGGQCD